MSCPHPEEVEGAPGEAGHDGVVAAAAAGVLALNCAGGIPSEIRRFDFDEGQSIMMF